MKSSECIYLLNMHLIKVIYYLEKIFINFVEQKYINSVSLGKQKHIFQNYLVETYLINYNL